ncbi:HEAT repeat domain-containing protein [Brucepastera parasyntrophica]|uniref:HEAT repeat domain-containing protein n=1 Tax=Brucepastera parasyntrophica TaxID=2880008 RepID=UPI00210E4F9F|nr:HEAT repeat domain-containing protein [Brucepastera parasyntrophica]ULQ59967.1 HEAT repeat domain-containing protein [Brucepastera parasyntrophica]
MRTKAFTLACAICFLAGWTVIAQQQQQQTDSIMTVEEAYLSSVESVIIKELAASEGRDTKLVALQYIENAVNAGRKTEEMQTALKSLASEGTGTVIRESGRAINNFPDIRRKACELLGQMGTPEAKDILITVMYADNEPTVISAAVKSLGELGYNDNDEVIDMINWIARKFDILLPTSSLALEVLNAYEKLAPTVTNKAGMIESIIRIANNYNYVTPVRNRAFEVLKKVSSSGSGNSNNNNNSSGS